MLYQGKIFCKRVTNYLSHAEIKSCEALTEHKNKTKYDRYEDISKFEKCGITYELDNNYDDSINLCANCNSTA